MGTYTTVAAGLVRLGRNGNLTTTTTPTLAEAADLLADVEALVEGELAGAGVTIPLTSPAAALAYVRRMVEYAFAAEVLKTRFPDTAGPGAESAWSFYEHRFHGMLDKMPAIINALTGDVPVSSVLLPTSYGVENPDEDNDLGTNAEPGLSHDVSW